MPHDRKGNLLQVNDIVNIPCKVTAVQTGEEYCNLNLESIEPMFPGTSKNSFVVNAKQVEKV
jgi:hypothetical protein